MSLLEAIRKAFSSDSTETMDPARRRFMIGAAMAPAAALAVTSTTAIVKADEAKSLDLKKEDYLGYPQVASMPHDFDAMHRVFLQKYVDAINGYMDNHRLTDDDLVVFTDVWEILPNDMALEMWAHMLKNGVDDPIARYNACKMRKVEILVKLFFALNHSFDEKTFVEGYRPRYTSAYVRREPVFKTMPNGLRIRMK